MQNLQDFQSVALRKVTTVTTADIRVLTFNDTSIRCIEINGDRRTWLRFLEGCRPAGTGQRK